MTTSIIVPIYQDRDTLAMFLQSLIDTIGHDAEVIFVNDGSGIEVSRLLKRCIKALALAECKNATLVVHDMPQGCGQSLNEALKMATGDMVFLLDSDLILCPGWRSTMESQLVGSEGTGMTASVLCYPQTGGIQHAGIRFTSTAARHWRLNALPQTLDETPYTVQAAPFAMFGLTRQVLDDVGGLDERYVNGYEDFDFQMRARACGYSVTVDPSVVNYHWEKRSGPHRSGSRKANLARFWKSWGSSVMDDTSALIEEGLHHLLKGTNASVVDLVESRPDAERVREALLADGAYSHGAFINGSHLTADNMPISLAHTVPLRLAKSDNPLIYFVENFVRLIGNHYWMERRFERSPHDRIVDLYGNQVGLNELAASHWPGSKVR